LTAKRASPIVGVALRDKDQMKKSIFRTAVGFFLLGAASFAQASPVNDDFTNRTVLIGSSVTFTGTLEGATLETGEPAGQTPPGSLGIWPYQYSAQVQAASVWWSWTAETSGPVTVEFPDLSMTNSVMMGAIDVWTGTGWPSDFQFVAGININIGRHPFFTFSATAGTTYHLRVIGFSHGDSLFKQTHGDPFTLKITETNVPIIVIQPFSRAVSRGDGVFFGVVAAGNPPFAPPFTYQWRSNGVDLPGETFPILKLDNLANDQFTTYSVVVSNGVAGIESDPVTLTVNDGSVPPQLIAVDDVNGQFRFRILGDPGRLYYLQTSADFVYWREERSFQRDPVFYPPSVNQNGMLYNNQSIYSVTNFPLSGFYRMLNYVVQDPAMAGCFNNLAAIRFAKEAWALEYKKRVWPDTSTPTQSDIASYLKAGVPSCPLAGCECPEVSYDMDSLYGYPVCKIVPPLHVLIRPRF
jgi:hypothetical protein